MSAIRRSLESTAPPQPASSPESRALPRAGRSAPKAQRSAAPAIVGAVGLCLVVGMVVATFRSSAQRTQAGSSEQAQAADAAIPQPMEAGAFGSVSGHLVPADGGAVVHFYKRDGSAPKYAFADPNSGAFTVPELPVDVYRVVVRPENPALEPRVIDDVVVPWGDRNDMGAIDLRPEDERFPIEDGDTALSGD